MFFLYESFISIRHFIKIYSARYAYGSTKSDIIKTNLGTLLLHFGFLKIVKGIFMGKVELNKKQKSESLLNKAFDLFIERGVSKTTVSDIAERAGVAKGTFYLYFKDKYDIRNRLVIYKASELFNNAYKALEKKIEKEQCKLSVEEDMFFIIDHILNALQENKPLLEFLHKDLSWGAFSRSIDRNYLPEDTPDFRALYQKMLEGSDIKFKEPDIMLYLIIELVGSAGYSAIIYDDIIPLDTLKPYLKETIRDILNRHAIPADEKTDANTELRYVN